MPLHSSLPLLWYTVRMEVLLQSRVLAEGEAVVPSKGLWAPKFSTIACSISLDPVESTPLDRMISELPFFLGLSLAVEGYSRHGFVESHSILFLRIGPPGVSVPPGTSTRARVGSLWGTSEALWPLWWSAEVRPWCDCVASCTWWLPSCQQA